MPTELGWRRAGSAEFEPVDDTNPLPVNPAALTSNTDSVIARLGASKTVSKQGVATTTNTTAVLTYTVPQGSMAHATNVVFINLGGSVPVVGPRYTPVGGTAEVLDQKTVSATTYTSWALDLWMAAGDTLDVYVTTGGATSTANCAISVVETAIT